VDPSSKIRKRRLQLDELKIIVIPSGRQRSERFLQLASRPEGSCASMPLAKRKIPHPYSPAEEYAGSSTGIRDDELDFPWKTQTSGGSDRSQFT
jgi:hypothetical protein